MPSPFPGMDPFIEGQKWRDFHTEANTAIRALLAPRLVPRHIVSVATLSRSVRGGGLCAFPAVGFNRRCS